MHECFIAEEVRLECWGTVSHVSDANKNSEQTLEESSGYWIVIFPSKRTSYIKNKITCKCVWEMSSDNAIICKNDSILRGLM